LPDPALGVQFIHQPWLYQTLVCHTELVECGNDLQLGKIAGNLEKY
jgi:hypothetical protein